MEEALKVLLPMMATVWILVESFSHLPWVGRVGKPAIALVVGMILSAGVYAAGWIPTPHGGARGLAAALVTGFLATMATKGAHDTVKPVVEKLKDRKN